MTKFHMATPEEIKKGETADIYFHRTMEILKNMGLSKTWVVAEVTTGRLPHNWDWGVLSGIEEELYLLEGLPVDVYAMPEGSIFYPTTFNGVKEPVMVIEGEYEGFGHLETAILGLLCQASGISTTTAHIKVAAEFKPIYSFGIRRMHPAIAPMIDRAAYIGGADGVSGISGARIIGIKPVGTMPHALIIIINDQREAWRKFDEIMDESIPRIALVDTFYDEKIEAIMAAETLKERLHGVRLDTPSSRRGNMIEIVKEVRWELDLRGYKHVKIMVSGGLDEESVSELSKAGVDMFGIGTRISNARTIDFALDIVEVNGKPVSKRGKKSGKKQIWRCQKCLIDVATPANEKINECIKCGCKELKPMLQKIIEKGKIIVDIPKPIEIREKLLEDLKKFINIRQQLK
ncbi:MAG: nicotinate phosphoribosyltransferase [Candidatus Methanomethylicia archaeon]|nr:nicotinate phosphoribosyltransferase [Candidatus Methanomethylicia archaeon]MCX8169001.1 nicotinate phosphoribosyltransferase [Candidatus Methanomethylicia archaeon]MDW7988732.1 nicotinate phosphoribosyltransferase [Nitrososphaerota archaeon]